MAQQSIQTNTKPEIVNEQPSINIEKLFEKKSNVITPSGFWSNIFNLGQSKKIQPVELSKQDKEVYFLLENNFLLNVAKLEKSGYVLNEQHKKDYNAKLYQRILNGSEEIIREYLLSDMEIPTKLLAIAFLMEIQEKRSSAWLQFNKTVTSFIDKVKKGLDADPVARYKMQRLNDKQFMNDLFDVWHELGVKHLNDIENHVTNKVPFLFFKIDKSHTRLQKDLDKFIEEKCQKHIYNAENFFSIPFSSTGFTKHISMEKMLKGKELVKRHEELYIKTKSFNNAKEAKLLNVEESGKVIALIERKVREHYQQSNGEILKDFQQVAISNSPSHKIVKPNIIQGIDNDLVKDVPEEALKIIDEVREISGELYKKELNDETKEIVSFLWEEKIPEIVKKYLNIDKEYRVKLKNVQGRNAKELMIESLEVIRESIKCIEKDINEEKLKNLSIHTRYLKYSLKK